MIGTVPNRKKEIQPYSSNKLRRWQRLYILRVLRVLCVLRGRLSWMRKRLHNAFCTFVLKLDTHQAKPPIFAHESLNT